MARVSRPLTAAMLRSTTPGLYADGGNLWLQITEAADGEDVNRSWIYRYTMDGRRRHMGLGSVGTVTLKEARERARQQRLLQLDGIDPITRRDEQRAAKAVANAKAITFAAATDAYVRAHGASWRNAKHAREWPASLRKHVFPTLGKLPVAAIETPLVLKALAPIWERTPETANRIRGRIEAVLDRAAVSCRPQGDNPARWSGCLEHLLPSPSKAKPTQHHAAMPFAEAPTLMAKLRAEQGVAARALEFLILTAARSGEVFDAVWNEFDGDLWTVPAERMKSGRSHAVPLAPRALELLAEMRALRQGELVFPGRDGQRPLGPAAMRQVLVRLGHGDVTAHGFRSAFRDWAGDRTNFAREVAEAALAHVIGDKAEQAYRRGTALDKRRKLMEAWASFCAQPIAKGDVVPLSRGRSSCPSP